MLTTGFILGFGLLYSLVKVLGVYNKLKMERKDFLFVAILLCLWLYYVFKMYFAIQMKLAGRVVVILNRFRIFVFVFIVIVAYNSSTKSYYSFLYSLITVS